MSNPPKQKGTAFETSLLPQLQSIWPDISRAQTNNESNDFTGPFPIEAKKRKSWAIPEWIRKIRKVAVDDAEWMIVVAPGDGRKLDAPPVIAVMPFEMAVRLLKVNDNQVIGHD